MVDTTQVTTLIMKLDTGGMHFNYRKLNQQRSQHLRVRTWCRIHEIFGGYFAGWSYLRSQANLVATSFGQPMIFCIKQPMRHASGRQSTIAGPLRKSLCDKERNGCEPPKIGNCLTCHCKGDMRVCKYSIEF